MFVSAELRWFWKESPPRGLDAWFRGGPFPPGGGRTRDDEYLIDSRQTELGLKKRGGKRGVELKGLVSLGETTRATAFAGRSQIWCKWTSEGLTIDRLPRVSVRKTRWLRKFDTSGAAIVERALDADERLRDSTSADRQLERGCQIEFVELRVGDAEARWWTFGFEAFDAFDRVEDGLHRTATHLAQIAPAPPALDGGVELAIRRGWHCSIQPRDPFRESRHHKRAQESLDASSRRLDNDGAMTVGRLASRGRSSHFPTLVICLFVVAVATCGSVSAGARDDDKGAKASAAPASAKPLDDTVKDLRTDVDKLKEDYGLATEVARLRKEIEALRTSVDELKKARADSSAQWVAFAIVGIAFAVAWRFVTSRSG